MFKNTINADLSLALVEESFASHYAELVQTQTDYLAEWLAWPTHCQSEQDFRIFVQRCLNEYAEGKGMTCAIWYKDRLVGNCSFNTIDHDLEKVTIGYWLSQGEQGKGIMSQVVTKLIDIAFNELGMQKVEAFVAEGNQPSRALCERLGFKHEGTITRAENLHGQIVDHCIYGLQRNIDVE